MEKVIKKILLSIFIFIITIFIQNICKAVNITTDYYKVDDDEKIIYEIEPETEIDNFKIRLSGITSETEGKDQYIEQIKSEIKIYKDKTYEEEVKEGFIGTGMILKTKDSEYELSVVGDFDGDGNATQLELSNIIRHIVGLKKSQLEGIKLKSADLTLDGKVDQRDITKFIRYIVFGELDLGKEDTIPPIVDIEVTKKAVSEITVSTSAIDRESGMGENPEFTFYIKKESESENAYVKKQSGKEAIFNATNLEPDTSYMIKVETQDKSGNKAEKTTTAKTGKIPDGAEEGAIKFGNTTWENESASISIETDKIMPIWEKDNGNNTTEKFQIEYQINVTTGNWTKGNNATELKHGDVLYARLTDGTKSGKYTSIKILDEIEPKVTLSLEKTQNKVIVATASATDSESGIGTGVKYKFSIKETNANDSTYVEKQNTTSDTCNFEELEPEKSYTIKVEVKDKAGNTGKQEKNIKILDDTAPVIKELTSTTNSIRIIATDADTGIIGYAVKTSESEPIESDFIEVENTKNFDITVTEKIQGTTYYVWVKDTVGNISECKSVTTGTVEGLTTSNTTFTYNPVQETWTNGSVTATVSTTVTGYTLQTSKDGQDWSDETSQRYTTNGTIHARLWDGTNAGTTLSANVTNIDKLAPKDFTPTATSTTKSITVTASATDADATSTSGKSGIAGYRFKLDNGEWTEYQTSGSYTWDNLTQTTDHTITVEAKDNAGNTKQGTVSKGTGTVTDLTPSNTTFTYNPVQETWTNGSVTATVSTTVTGYTLQTSKDGQDWSNETSQTFTGNGTIHARLWDGTNAGTSLSANVTNIDKLEPKDFTPTATSTTKSITVTASATDADATSTSGKSGIAGYRFKLDSGEWTEYQTSGSYTWDNLTQTTNHTITVEAKDNAGNTKQGTVSKGTGTVTALTSSNTTFTYNPVQETWTNGSVTATVSTTVTGYTLQTSKDGQDWSNETSQTFTGNGTIYARLWDGTNAGTTLSANVTNIDTLAPNAFTPTATSTTKSITVTASATDADATSTSAKSGIAGYRFKLDNGSWTNYQTSGSYTWNNLTQTTNHTITVEAKDNAGNTKQATVNKGTGTIEQPTTATCSPTTWTNENVTVTLPTKTGFTTRYTTDGTKPTTSSTAYSAPFTVSGNCVITFVYSDGTNVSPTAQTANVTNIDKLAPKDFTPTASSTTKSITVTASATDADATSTSGKSGIAGYRFKLDSGEWTEYQTSGSYTWDNLAQTADHTMTVEAKDNAGNTKQSIVNKGTGSVTDLTPSNVTFTYNPNTWTNGSVKVTVALKDMTSEYTLKITDSDPAGASKETALGWANGSTGVTVSSNKIVYAVLVDNEGQRGGATTGSVTIIDKTKPVVTGATTTSNSIKITATDEASGIVGYAVTTSNAEPEESDYTIVTSTQTLDTTVKGKTQGTTYYVWVKDAAGNVSESKSTATDTVTALTSSNTSFSYNPSVWTNGSVKATASTTVNGFTLQTSKDGTTWNSTAEQTFTGNGTIHARLWDGTNAGESLTANVTNIDTLAPNAFTPTATSTTKSITVTASATDADATSTSGKSEIAGYRFKLDSENWTNYQTSGSYTWNNLTQTTNHTITVEAKDNAGNTKTGTVSKGTGAIEQPTTATCSPTTWTNENVTVTLPTKTGFTTRYTTDGTKPTTSSTAYSAPFTVSGNCVITFVYSDGTNVSPTAQTANVTNIDKLAPKDFTPTATSTTKSITVTASATDADATSTSAKSEIAGYRFKLDSGEWTEYQTEGTYTWDKLAQTTSHSMTVEAKDNAGNTKQETITKGTGTVQIPTTATCTPTEWTNSVVTVTLPTEEGFTTRYTIDGTIPTEESAAYSEPFTVSSNCTITYIYSDGTNLGQAQTANVSNIDITAPTISTALNTTSSTIDSIALSVGITDTNSGLGKIEWYYGETEDTMALAGTTSVTDLNGSTTGPTTAQTQTYTITGLKPVTTYYFKAIVYDVAGNVVTSPVISADTLNPTAEEVSYEPSDTTWNVENVKQALDSLYSR